MTGFKSVYIVAAGATILLVTLGVSRWSLQRKGDVRAAGSLTPIELQAVEFCGVRYYTRPVVLFGIDMMARIAEIATVRPKTFVCKNIQGNPDGSKPLSVEVQEITLATGEIIYYLQLESLLFSFSPVTEEIFLHSGFDGTPHPFGNFK